MTDEPRRWERVTEAFGHLAELSAGERTDALRTLETADPAVHAEVVSLLVSSDCVGDRFDQPGLFFTIRNTHCLRLEGHCKLL